MCLLKNKKEICKKTGFAIDTVTHNRNKKIKDIMHKLSRYIVDYCVEHKINADVNAAYNIIRKVFPNAFKGHGIEGVVLHPKRLSILDILS